MKRFRVASIQDVPQDEGLSVQVLGVDIALFRTPEGIRAVGDSCPHMGAQLSDGYVDGENVVCPWHGWTFSLKDGSNPFDDEESIPVFNVVVEGDDVYVETDEARCAALRNAGGEA